MPGFVNVAKLSELEEGKGKKVTINEELEVAIFKVGGKVYAIQEKCPHQGGPLSEGDLEGLVVMCPWHGMTYNLSTGKAAPQAWDQALSVKTFNVVVEGDDVKIEV
jgi:nitrite reductase/ring-hydroxylating ferredoxin subunit